MPLQHVYMQKLLKVFVFWHFTPSPVGRGVEKSKCQLFMPSISESFSPVGRKTS